MTAGAVLVLIAAGCVLRLAWALNGHLRPVNSEAYFIARALAEGRGFSDAFGVGTGPTAHLMPTTPLPAALVYSALGAGAPAAELALSIWSIGIVALSILLAERILRELSADPWARVLGVGFASLVPIQIGMEVMVLRVWESGLAAVLLLAVVLACLRLDRSRSISLATLVGIGLANAVVFLVSPVAAIATSGVIGVLFLRKVSPLRWAPPVLVAMAVVAAVVIPWGLRNQAALGAFIPLRSGEGIQLAIAYHDGRLSPNIQTEDLRRFREVSPLMGEAARQRYLEVGEVEYNRELAQEAHAWIAAHPQETWTLRVRNFVQFYAPPAWLWTRFTDERASELNPRRVLTTAIAIIAWVTLIAMLVGRQFRWLYLLPAILLPSLPYVMTYPLLRYRYLISTLLVFVAAHGVLLAFAWVARRRSGTARAH